MGAVVEIWLKSLIDIFGTGRGIYNIYNICNIFNIYDMERISTFRYNVLSIFYTELPTEQLEFVCALNESKNNIWHGNKACSIY